MDGQRFDELTRVFGLSLTRKRFVALVGGLFGTGAAAVALDRAEAKNRKGSKKRRRRSGGVGAQGSNGVCDALCSGNVPDPRFCGNFGNCGSDDDCIFQDPSRPICCTTSPGCGGAGEGACCSAPTCAGFCDKDSDCPDLQDCICDESTNTCVSLICGGECSKDTDCQPLSGCTCEVPNGQAARTQGPGGPSGPGVGAEGGTGPTGPGQCVTQTCGGSCIKDSDCSPLVDGCICDESSGECVTVQCPGRCNDNDDCFAQGQDECACILFGPDRAASDVGVEGEIGACGACRGLSVPCSATTECCGQLVCEEGAAAAIGIEGRLFGTCQRKPTPPDRCKKHGQGCRVDRDCCAQAVCYKGKCGEKDTHCNNNGECAAGYRCQGGPLAPGHRRCRKNGKRKRNKTHRRHG